MFPVHQVWPKPFFKAQWKGEEDKADRGRGGKTTSGNGQAWSSASTRGQWRKGKMEKTGCKIICGAPTTLAVKGLMMMMSFPEPTSMVDSSLRFFVNTDRKLPHSWQIWHPQPPPPPSKSTHEIIQIQVNVFHTSVLSRGYVHPTPNNAGCNDCNNKVKTPLFLSNSLPTSFSLSLLSRSIWHATTAVTSILILLH